MKEKEEINLVFDGFEFSGSIFIANYAAARCFSILNQNKIGAIVSAGRGLFLSHSKQQIPNYLYLPIDDSPEQQLAQFFNLSYEFIDKNIARTNVLVHCYSGISRSAAIIASYLIKKFSFSLRESIILLRNNKRRIRPNPSFLRQLLELEQIQSGTSLNLQSLPKDRQKAKTAKLDLASLKSEGQNIAAKISSARVKLEGSHERRRQSSDLLRKCLKQRSQRDSIATLGSSPVDADEDHKLFEVRPKGRESYFDARMTFG